MKSTKRTAPESDELNETKRRLRDAEERIAQLNGYIAELEQDLGEYRGTDG